MNEYRIVTLNPDAVAVEMRTNDGWVVVQTFSGLGPQRFAERWIARQR